MDYLPGDKGGPAKEPYKFIDNGGHVLLVAHTDSVCEQRFLHADRQLIISPTLDNRIGVYLALVEFPLRGIRADVLLTTNEEWGASTGFHFTPPAGKSYNWIAEFDRMGFDCAMYGFRDATTDAAVKAAGYNPVYGSYSDIADMEHLGVKAFNFGVAYHDYHSANSHIYTADLAALINMFVKFYQTNHRIKYTHTPRPKPVYTPTSWRLNDFYGPGKSTKVTKSTSNSVLRCDFCKRYTPSGQLAYTYDANALLCPDCMARNTPVTTPAAGSEIWDDWTTNDRWNDSVPVDDYRLCDMCDEFAPELTTIDLRGVAMDCCQACTDFYIAHYQARAITRQEKTYKTINYPHHYTSHH